MEREVLYHLQVIIKFFLFYLLGILVGRKIDTPYIYIIAAVAFLGGFILRWLNLYPGRSEPLWMDFYTSVFSFSLLVLCIYSITIPLKYGLLFIFSIHIIYNLYVLLGG